MDSILDETKVVVIGVHGVGDTKPNFVHESVAANLKGGGIDVEVAEYCWNERVQKPLAEGKLRFEALQNIVSNLISAGTLGFRRKPGEHNRLGTLLNYGFEWAHILISLSVVSLAFLPLLTMTVLFPFNEWLGTSLFQFEWIWPFAVGLVLAGSCFLMISIILSLFSGNRAIIGQSCRRVLFTIIAPLISILCIPFLVPWKIVFEIPWKTVLKTKALWWLVAIALIIVIGEARYGYDISSLKWPLIAVASFPVALFALGTLTEVVVGPVLKILLDIFCYVSDPEYRSHLQEGLRDLLVQSKDRHGNNVHYVVLAHSLGSVIVVDSLINFECWQGARRLTLITMGSPLRRLFGRFFPGAFFPVPLDVTYEAIAERVAGFRWINIYRPWDQIGASFGARKAGGIVEIPTGQWTKILTAHVDYWSDPLVRDKVVAEMNRPQEDTVLKPALAIQAGKVRADYTPVPYFSTLYRSVPTWLFAAIGIAVVTLSSALTIGARVAMNRKLDMNLAALASAGTKGQAQVNLVEEVSGGQGEPPETSYHFTVSYGHDGEHIEVMSPNKRRSSRRIAFDWRKLAGAIMEKGEHVRHSSMFREYVLSGVEIRYLPSDPRIFDLPAYPYHRSVLDEVGAVVLMAIMLIMPLAFIWAFGALLIKWFLGLPMES